MTQPPSTFTQFVFIGSEVQLFPPSDIGCEYNAFCSTTFLNCFSRIFLNSFFCLTVRFGISYIKRDHNIDDVCILNVNAVAPQYLPISAPIVAYSAKENPKPPFSFGITNFRNPLSANSW